MQARRRQWRAPIAAQPARVPDNAQRTQVFSGSCKFLRGGCGEKRGPLRPAASGTAIAPSLAVCRRARLPKGAFVHITRSISVGLLAAALLASAAPSLATTNFGTLSNFDTFNDTGDDCHGFEIELEGLDASDVIYTFGEPYQRYGNPVVVPYAGGVYVRYQSGWDAGTQTWAQATPKAPAAIVPTDGHACWTGGSGDYLTSGCEHFGVSLVGNPTKTVYRWLVADPLNPGQLKRADTQVNIPAPIWKVSPPPPDAPDQVHPVVAAVIEPPEPGAYDFGDAIWMKIYVTESPEPAELDHLLSEDDRVPDEPAEVEMEWELLQSEKGQVRNSEHGAQVGEGDESVTRRYEFYEYTGPYDAESHEARPEHDSDPLPEEIGNYIGAQMAAVNLSDPIVVTTTTTSTSTTMDPVLCGDANGDGEVKASDALAALRAAVGLDSPCTMATCDVDSSGQIRSSDALRILRKAVGQLVTLSCPP